MNTYFNEYQYDEAIDLITHAPRISLSGGSRPESESGSFSFTGTKSYKEALGLARDGWHEGTKKISDMRDSLMDQLATGLLDMPQPYMDVSGFEVDAGAWVAGEPEHMVDLRLSPAVGKHVHLMANIATSCYQGKEAMEMRGLLAAGLVDTLEHIGYRVTLDVVQFVGGSYGNNSKHTLLLHLKRAEEVLDIDRVTFALAHPSMLRRIVFAIEETFPAKQRSAIGSGYGSPKDDPTDPDYLPAHLMPDLYIGNANDNMRNMGDVVTRIKKYLADGGFLNEG